MLVFGVFVIPILLHAAIPLVAVFLIPPGRKVAFSVAPAIGAEGTFVVSAPTLEREAVRRYRNPRAWFVRTGKS